ncbi:hypothetical protein [Streptomyces cadmiisoli]|uniref:hypothetical protein n=1 Tax=Streptomyces cadmiisoli TaxID=2184053 RepID=UPI003D72B90D
MDRVVVSRDRGAVSTDRGAVSMDRVAVSRDRGAVSTDRVRAVGPLVMPYGAAAVADAKAPSPDDSPSGSASAGEPTRAGSRAGEGRQRPGRIEPPSDEATAPTGNRRPADDVPEPPSPSGDPTAREPGTVQEAAPDSGRTGGPVVTTLPLGSGLVLIGLGLGLTFVALRVRRGPE